MSILTGLTKGVTGWASGFNFYKWGAILVIVAAILVGVDRHATHKAELACEEQKTAVALERVHTVVRTVTMRVPEVQKQDSASTERRDDVRQKGVKLDEAITKNAGTTGCNLSDDELRSFQDLAESTR
jgi:hypothetical protein